DDRVLALSALNFDLTVYDIFGLLAAGGAIVVPDAGTRRDPSHWAALARREGVTLWNSVPALMTMLLEHTELPEQLPDRLRLVMLSGDWIPVSLPDRMRRIWPHIVAVSLGGATEASIWSILHLIRHVDPAAPSIPYGVPMLNQRFHVFDDNFAPCPIWTA